MSTLIYKIVTRDEWEVAQTEGVYRGSPHDQRDGFIHFSTAAQLEETARKHFSVIPDLLLLTVDMRILGKPSAQLPTSGKREGLSELRWEPSRGGALFPHLYAALPLNAVVRVEPLALDETGTPLIPVDLVI